MDTRSRLRPYLGASANLVDTRTKDKNRPRLIDITKTRRGEEITIIEVGEHGITVEFVKSGHKQTFTFSEIRFEGRRNPRIDVHRKHRLHSGKAV